ncbi:fimbrial protein [Leclercia adecarboxylata]|uniref:fimbrial protein n=1 Tax=Leclercia adecarboxylata TaxID=83655 RepID=UPI002DBB1CB3|nr:fimbrial protein [Leclercia adecarboxylata]MEB6377645.1 fimbrial protein [Leclercia adecarboxylata]
MNNKNKILAVTLCTLMMASANALAALPSGNNDNGMNTNAGTDAGTQGTGGVVHFTGKITDASCNVSTDTAGQTIDLGTWAASYFASQKETTRTPFHISVEGCPDSVKSVAVLFDGTKDTTDSALLGLNSAVDSDGNTATGVAVKLYESDRNTQIKIGDISKKVDLAEGEDSTTLNFYANYNATADNVTTGKADADANFLMVYN